MYFGTIGSGTVAQALARHLVTARYRVMLSNSRGPSTLEEVVANLGPLASAGTVAQAAEADMVFLTVTWPNIPAALADLPPWDGRTLVDTTKAIARVADEAERQRIWSTQRAIMPMIDDFAASAGRIIPVVVPHPVC